MILPTFGTPSKLLWDAPEQPFGKTVGKFKEFLRMHGLWDIEGSAGGNTRY